MTTTEMYGCATLSKDNAMPLLHLKLWDAPYSKTIDWAKWYIFWVPMDLIQIRPRPSRNGSRWTRGVPLFWSPDIKCNHRFPQAATREDHLHHPNSASNVAVIVTGGSKAEAMRLAVDASDVRPDSLALPARLVQPTKGKLVRFVDRQAALKLAGVQWVSRT